MGRVPLRELVDLVLLPGECTHHADAGEILLNGGGHSALRLVLGPKDDPDTPEEHHGEEENEWDHIETPTIHTLIATAAAASTEQPTNEFDHLTGEKDPDRVDVRVHRCDVPHGHRTSCTADAATCRTTCRSNHDAFAGHGGNAHATR